MIGFFRRKIIWIPSLVFCVLLIMYIAFIGGLYVFFGGHKQLPEISELPYRTEIQPLKDRFGEIIDIESCFWKADVESAVNFGPSTYWMKGFIVLSKEEADKINSQYDWTPTSLTFLADITPNITGFSDFNWKHSEKFSADIRGSAFGGEIYCDTKNGILYFNLESN